MSPDRSMPSHAIAQAVIANAGGRVVDEPWMCDVKGANAELISQHNDDRRKRGLPIEPHFDLPCATPLRLGELLGQDYDFLSIAEPPLQGHKHRYLFVEIDNPRIQSQCLHLSGDPTYSHAIAFTGNLIRFIHAALSKTTMLLQHTRTEGCLEEHDALAMTDAYSDLNLVIGLLNDFETVYLKNQPCTVSPPHLSRPYDYCEEVDGTRRFVLGHELGHSIVDRLFGPDKKRFRASNFIAGAPPDQFWTEEQFCDVYATLLLLNAYQSLYEQGSWTESLSNQLLNNVSGLLTFVALLDMLQIAFNGRRLEGRSHPPNNQRLHLIHLAVKTHPLFTEEMQFLRQLYASWWHIGELRRLIRTTTATEADFRQLRASGRLSPFAYNAYRAITNLRPTGPNVFGIDTSMLGFE